MNILSKQHFTIEMSAPANRTSRFITRITIDAFLSGVGILMQSPEEQAGEPMPVALATLLLRVDELAAHHSILEECIGQIEREWE